MLPFLLLFAASLPDPVAVIPLQAELDHVQGIEVDDERLWVTSVDRKQKRGWLHEFDLKSGKLRRKLELTFGEQYHPGGLMKDGRSLWIPVAEYRRNSSAIVQEVDAETFQLGRSLKVDDHIGAVAIINGKVYGANWDARHLIDLETGARKDNPHATSYQDMKYVDGVLVASGVVKGKGGAIDFLNPETLELQKRIEVGTTDRGIIYTHEGMAIRGRNLYLLPEDGPSRLFVFLLSE